MSFDSSIKVTLLGDAGSGKSSIINQFISQSFQASSPPTIGASNQAKTIYYTNREYTFSIWDTAGQERYRSISKMLYRDAKAVILVFDLTSRESFSAVNSWYSSVQETSSKQVIIILAANKTDEENWEVERKDVENYAKLINSPVFFVSAKTGENVYFMFEKIAEILGERGKARNQSLAETGDKSSFILSESHLKGKKKRCC